LINKSILRTVISNLYIWRSRRQG